MFTYESLLFTAILSSPVDSKPFTPFAELSRPTVLAICLDAEIIDTRERGHFFADLNTSTGDLEYLQRLYRRLVNLPGLEECRRFPKRQVINEYLSFNRDYRNDLQKRIVIDPVHADQLRETIFETDQLYQIWDTLRDASCDYYYAEVRRQALQTLKEMIGPEMFYRGVMPPHVVLRSGYWRRRFLKRSPGTPE